MANKVVIKAQHISEINFTPFGQILGRNTGEKIIQPEKGIIVTPGVGQLEIEKGELELIFLNVLQRGFIVEGLERHLFTSQAFIPLSGCCGLFLLAPPEDLDNEDALPDLGKATAVIFDGTKGVNLKRGTWHSAPFALSEASNYIMVSRRGTLKDDLHLVNLKKQMNKYFEILL